MSLTSPMVEALRVDARVRRTLFAVVAVHLVMSIRFFHDYVEAAPWLAYSAFVAGGMVACAVVLRVPCSSASSPGRRLWVSREPTR